MSRCWRNRTRAVFLVSLLLSLFVTTKTFAGQGAGDFCLDTRNCSSGLICQSNRCVVDNGSCPSVTTCQQCGISGAQACVETQCSGQEAISLKSCTYNAPIIRCEPYLSCHCGPVLNGVATCDRYDCTGGLLQLAATSMLNSDCNPPPPPPETNTGSCGSGGSIGDDDDDDDDDDTGTGGGSDNGFSCEKRCLSRDSNGTCRGYGQDFCGRNPSCIPQCSSRDSNGTCRGYGADYCIAERVWGDRPGGGHGGGWPKRPR